MGDPLSAGQRRRCRRPGLIPDTVDLGYRRPVSRALPIIGPDPRSLCAMIRFRKMHGLGNDFVILDAREGAVEMDAGRARAIADRRTGVGCDQVILLEPSEVADVRMRIWNADGGEVEACGNASRCVALLEGGETSIETRGGIVRAAANGRDATVDMG